MGLRGWRGLGLGLGLGLVLVLVLVLTFRNLWVLLRQQTWGLVWYTLVTRAGGAGGDKTMAGAQ